MVSKSKDIFAVSTRRILVFQKDQDETCRHIRLGSRKVLEKSFYEFSFLSVQQLTLMRGKVKRIGKAEGAERCTRNKVQRCLTEVYKQALVEPGDELLQYPSLTDNSTFLRRVICL